MIEPRWRTPDHGPRGPEAIIRVDGRSCRRRWPPDRGLSRTDREPIPPGGGCSRRCALVAVKGETSTVLLIVDLALVALIVVALWVASRRGRARRRRARARADAPELADLIPGRAIVGAANGPPVRRTAPSVPRSRATWSASTERGETVEPSRAVVPPPAVALPSPVEPAAPEPEPGPEPVVASTNGFARAERPAVIVAPRDGSWVVRRDGASRVSSVHASRDAAESRARKTAQRERVVLEVRDRESVVLDRTDYANGDRANR